MSLKEQLLKDGCKIIVFKDNKNPPILEQLKKENIKYCLIKLKK